MAVLRVILGILMFIGGLFCAFTPLVTYDALPTVIAIVMLVEGVTCFVLWLKAKRAGESGIAILLVNAILSVILGVMLLLDDALHLSMELTIPIMVSSWMVVNGIFQIIDSFQIKKLGKQTSSIRGKDAEAVGIRAMMRDMSKHWWIHLILGILMVIVGGISFSSPFVTALSIGTWMGLEIAFTGLDMIFTSDDEETLDD